MDCCLILDKLEKISVSANACFLSSIARAAGKVEDLPQLADQLMRLKVDPIVVGKVLRPDDSFGQCPLVAIMCSIIYSVRNVGSAFSLSKAKIAQFTERFSGPFEPLSKQFAMDGDQRTRSTCLPAK